VTSIIHPLQSVSAGVYTISVINAVNLPHSFIKANAYRITRAYVHGEPIWMIADELRMVYGLRKAAIDDIGVRVSRLLHN
jgi:hypothetical protein